VATSIIDVQVNTEQFGQFVQAWNRYQEQLKGQPGLWNASAEAAAGVGAGFAAMTAAILEQNAAWRKQDELRKEREALERKAAADKKKADQEQDAREKEAERRRKKAVEDTAKIARNVADTAVGLAKWAALGGLAGAVGGALSFWGLDQFFASVGQERRLAQGYGVTTGQRQALGINMSPYLDVNSSLENIATAQNDPSKRWIFSSMGVNPNGKDPAELLTEMAVVAGRVFKQSGNNLLYAQARGLTDIFDPDTLRRLAQDQGEVGRAGARARSEWGPGGALYLSDQTNQKWQQFIVRLDEAGQHLKNVLVDDLVRLEPNLEVMINQFTALADQVLKRIDWQVLGDGLSTFTKYIGSPQFQNDFKKLADNVSLVGAEIMAVAEKLKWLLPQPTDPSPKTNPSGGSPFQNKVGGWWADVVDPFHLSHKKGQPILPGKGFGADIWSMLGQLTGHGNATIGLPTAGQALFGLRALENGTGLVPGLLSAIYQQESASGAHAGFSRAGALGPFQFTAGTAAQMGVKDRLNFGQSAVGAAKYLNELLGEFHGDTAEAIAAYNEGPGAVRSQLRRYGSHWLEHASAETRSYVARVEVLVRNQTGASVAVSANQVAK
jgi:hypothetical protein